MDWFNMSEFYFVWCFVITLSKRKLFHVSSLKKYYFFKALESSLLMNILYFILWFIEVFQSSLIVTKIPKWKMLINYCLGKKHLLPIKFSSCPKTTGPICHSFFLLAWGLGCEPGHQQSPINGTRVFAHSLSLSPATVLCHVICNDQSQASIQVTWPTVLCPESPEFSHGHILSWSVPGQLEEVRACQHCQQQTPGRESRMGNCFRRCDLGEQ